MDQISKSIEKNWPKFLSVLKQVMQVPSVKGIPSEHAPYGVEPRRVLELVLSLGEEFGFQTKVINDAIGYVQWGNNDEDYLGILGHLDVVAAGSNWDFPPFDLSEQNGRFYGRGILDNKGPIISCLYGLKLLKDLGFKPQKTIRVIFGTDEESGMSDVPQYLSTEVPPTFGFTPDCKYPVVYGERGIVNVQIHYPLTKVELATLSEFEGDQFRDHVPDRLQVLVDGQKYAVSGKRSPSNAPELGNNAITLMAEKLKNITSLPANLKAYFSWLFVSFHEKHYGEGIDLELADIESGKLILTPVVLQKDTSGLNLEIAFRYPVTVKEETVLAGLRKSLPETASLEIVRSIPSICHNQDSPDIAKLSAVYGEVTGNDSTPVTTTGATYARKMPNILAFGPSFPGQKGIAHNKNEYMDAADLRMNLEIYTRSIKALAE